MKKLSQSTAVTFTAIMGALAVALGAFGAHGLEGFLVENGRMETWRTAAGYHLIHSVALVALVAWKDWKPWAWFFIAVGILIFSGSLYLLCLTRISGFGAVTPLGGICLIIGWVAILFR